MKTKVREFTVLAKLVKALAQAAKSGDAILLDEGLSAHYPSIAQLSVTNRVLLLAGGEEVKHWNELGRILSFLAENQIERGSALYVVGGGALCDVGALAAALYRRGINLILVPTTLLAQADAAIGGKCAVDLVQDGHLLKNVAGTFYPAQEMWLFTGWWRSLPARERRSGLAEVLKILWLFAKPTPTAGLRDWCEGQSASSAGLDRLLKTAIVLKQKIVLKDPRDRLGQRASLNFGHSIGHALESLSQGKLSHGEAIAWGMWAECELAGSRFAKDIYKTLIELEYKFPQVSGSTQAWEKLLVQDKKMKSKKLPLIYLTAPGKIKILALTPKVVASKSMQLFA